MQSRIVLCLILLFVAARCRWLAYGVCVVYDIIQYLRQSVNRVGWITEWLLLAVFSYPVGMLVIGVGGAFFVRIFTSDFLLNFWGFTFCVVYGGCILAIRNWIEQERSYSLHSPRLVMASLNRRRTVETV